MKNELTRTDDCGCGGGKMWILLLVVVAFFLMLLAGALLVGGLLLMWLLFSGHSMAPPPVAAPPPIPPPVFQMPDLFGMGQIGIGVLLLGATLLLLLILILLVVLLFCSCGQPRGLKDLLKLLPMLKDLGIGLRAASQALAAMELGLRAAQVPVEAAGRLLKEAGDKVNVNIPILSARTRRFNAINADVVVGLDSHNWQPFGEVRTKLSDTGAKLKDSPDGLSAKLDEVADKCHEASDALGSIANAISPP